MAFFDQQFPPEYTFGAKGGPVFSTEVVKTSGGQRYANRNWQYPLHQYDISAGIKSRSDFEVYRAFFYNVAGQFDGFRFKDWHDYQLINQPLAEVSPGAVYQLQRVYVAGIRTYARPILKPANNGTLQIERVRGGSPSVITPSVDFTTGLVSVTGHMSGDTYTAVSGDFDVPVVFTSDQMEVTIVDKNRTLGLIEQWPTVTLEELRNP